MYIKQPHNRKRYNPQALQHRGIHSFPTRYVMNICIHQVTFIVIGLTRAYLPLCSQMYYSMRLLKSAAHIPSDFPSNFRCSKLLTNLSQNPWLDPNLPATYCWYKSWWNSSASWRIFFQVLLKMFSIKRLLLKMLQALCVSNSPLSLSPQTKMVGRGWCYVEKMVISFTSSLRLHKAPKHRETLLSSFKHQPWFCSTNGLQKHQPSAITWLWYSRILLSQRQRPLWLQLVGATQLETSIPMPPPGTDALATFSTAHAY